MVAGGGVGRDEGSFFSSLEQLTCYGSTYIYPICPCLAMIAGWVGSDAFVIEEEK